MVAPPPTAAPCTAAISGLSKLISAFIRRACGLSPCPGGFFRKSSTSLPAVNESPAPSQITTRIRSSFTASLKRSARESYMAEVIAFFLAGRFNVTRKMLPESSVKISLIAHLLLRRRFTTPRHDAARDEAVDLFGIKAQFPENLFIVFAEFRGSFCGYLVNAVYLNRAADC